MLTVLTWLWSQPGMRTRYRMDHVRVWADMVSRNLAMPHRLACVTNEEGLPAGVERIAPPGEFEDVKPRWGLSKPNCYRRLSMFRPDAAKLFGEQFVCMDLDCVIGGPLDPLFDRPEELVLFKGTSADRPYNGSMMLIRAGCRPQVYKRFNQDAADMSGQKFVGSDQAWLALCLGWGEKVWDGSDGVHFYGREYLKDRPSPRILFFPGKQKPWDIAKFRIDRFTTNNYRIAEREAA